MEPEGSLPHSQASATLPYPGLAHPYKTAGKIIADGFAVREREVCIAA